MNILISESGTKTTVLDEVPPLNEYVFKLTSYGYIIFKTCDGVILLQDFIKVYSPTIQ
jgi:hypothetical protein